MLRLEYILTSGAQYFDSGYVPTVNTVVEVECCEDPAGAASSTYCLFGTGTSNSDTDGTNFSFFNNVSGSTKVRVYGNYYTIPAATLSPYRRVKLQVDKLGAREIYYVQEGTPYQYTSKTIPLIGFEPPASPSTISKSLFFGAQNYNGSPNSYTTSRFYNITILEKDNAGQAAIKKKYIPVLRGTVAGFYEEISGTFIPSTSSTPFKAGPILYPYGTKQSDSADTVHTLTNLISDPYFTNSGWKAHANLTYSTVKSGGTNPTGLFKSDEDTGSKLGQVVATATMEAQLRTTTNISRTSGHKYFFSFYKYQKDYLCQVNAHMTVSNSYFGNDIGSSITERSPVARIGEWVRYSGINTVTSTTTAPFHIGLYGYTNSPTESGTMITGRTAWYTGAMLVDLTATFGAGNEPTNKWCEANLPFFETSFTYENWVPKFKATYNNVSKWYPIYRAYKKMNSNWVLWAKASEEAPTRGEVTNLRQQLMLNASQKEMVVAPNNYNFNMGKQEQLISTGGILKKDDDGDCAFYFKGLGAIKGSGADLDGTDFIIHWKEKPENTANNFVYTSVYPTSYNNTGGYGAGGLMLGYTSSSRPLIYASSFTKYNYNILNGVQMAATRIANVWHDMTFVRRGGRYYVYQNSKLAYWGPFTRELGYQSFLPSAIGRWTDSNTSGGSYYVGYIKDFYIKRKNCDLLFPYPDDSLTNRANLLLAAPVWGTYLTQTNDPVAITNTMTEYTSGTGEKIFSCNAAGTSFIVTHTDIGNFSTGDFSIIWEEYINSAESNYTAGLVLGNSSGYTALISYKYSGATLLFYASSDGSSWNKVNGTSMGDKILDKWVKRAVIRKGTNIYCFQNDVLYSIIPNVDTIKIGNNSIMFGGTGWNCPANRLFRNIQIYKDSSPLKGVTLPAQPSITTSYNSTSDLLINLPLESCRDEGPNHFEITNNYVTFTTDKTFNGAPTAYFNGSAYLSFSYIIGEEISSNDLTIEWWEYPLTGSYTRFCTNSVNNSGYGGLLLGYDGTSLFASGSNSSWNIVNDATAFSNTLDTWTHWAVVRKNGVFKTYQNGTLFYTGATNTTAIYWSNTYDCSIGRYRPSNTNFFKGYMSNFKIYRGCKYDGNFIVTAPSENS